MSDQRRSASFAGLRKRFIDFWQSCHGGRQRPHAEQLWAELSSCYAEPHRHYHVLGHLAHCLSWQQETAELMQQPDAVEMALWYHDIICLPRCQENEQQSMELFAERAKGLFDDAFIQAVNQGILATTHRSPPKDQTSAFVVDIDLSSLGMNWEDFLEDSANIRKEFTNTPGPGYYRANHAFLSSLINRGCIYYTDFYHQTLEQRAQENIERYLHKLESEGYLDED